MISIIAAVAKKDRAIGKENRLLWNIPEDLKRFKKLTSGHYVIMGQRTFQSIGKPLPNRTNIVISNDPKFKAHGTIVVHSIEEALDTTKTTQQSNHHPELEKVQWTFGVGSGSQRSRKDFGMTENDREVFIIGGGQIYKQFLPLADKLYITEVEGEYEADIYFPDYSDFKIISEESGESNGYKYKFLELIKKD